MTALRSVDVSSRLGCLRREVWSARDLMPVLGFDSWAQLVCVLEKARFIAQVQGFEPDALFVRVTDHLDGEVREDFLLRRHAAYLVAAASDTSISTVADAYDYFAPTIRKDPS